MRMTSVMMVLEIHKDFKGTEAGDLTHQHPHLRESESENKIKRSCQF